uniref:SWIM-type domain-containing protein n=1 Tax=Brassica oleracea var. oleracea TaxID=109376 RepID=A0A0D3D6X5_BRAOL
METDVKKWARCQFHGYRYDIRTNNPAESINSALHLPREFPVIPLLDSIREMLTRWFFKRKKLIKHTHRLTIDVEEKIDMRIEKGKTFGVYPVTDSQLLFKGDTIDCFVDLEKRTCSCGKYDLLKIPCRHAIKAAWREAYQESINPISVPEDGWSVPQVVENSEVLPPEKRRSLGRNRKHIYETVEDKI